MFGLLIALLLSFVLVFEQGLRLLNAAERLQAAALAGFGVLARVNLGAAGEKIFGQLLDVFPPVDQALGSELFLTRLLMLERSASSVALASPTTSGKGRLSRPNFGKDQPAELFVIARAKPA